MVKPSEEAKFKEPVVVKADFIAAMEQEDHQSVCSECSVHVGTLFEEKYDPIRATQSVQVKKEGSTPNPKEEECILAMEENNKVLEDSNMKKAAEEPLVLPSTSSPLSSDVEEEFDLSNFMFENEGNCGDQVADQEDTMKEVEHKKQGNHEVDYLSDL
ncbi:hypothetical protein KI387_033044 [Taxus chinensis]|uniref:Uncharacterized protein n=1 Tax=Taxus chinensis TaxID=29808 RepID=A0AA38F5G4_TAXCH|nr:hypothetical protein KI387_033044 [Taxus chinensis]